MRRLVIVAAMLTCIAWSAGGAVADDQQIAQSVVERLNQEKSAGRLKGFGIDLQVEQGVVWLKGHVASQDQHRMVLESVRRVPGVKTVVNDLTVEGSAVPFVSAQQNAPQPVAPSTVARPAAPGQPGFQPTLLNSGVVGASANAPAQQPIMQQAPRALPVEHASQVHAPHGHAHPAQFGAAPAPIPTYVPAAGNVAPAAYDNPYLPNYAWPGYAAYPNYGAVTYPQQYSPTAWPYIGPFYPYPQVPLGWRKVTMEWKDGWWWLDFRDRSRNRSF